MKKFSIAIMSMAISFFALSASAGWDPTEVETLSKNSDIVLANFLEKDPKIQAFIDKAAGYVVFPSVAKGGLGIGGARGKGLLYENGEIMAVVTLTQLSIGFQAGGQAYSEFIFFEGQDDVADFKKGNYELGAQASAVAITAGISADAAYNNGVAIFTQAKGGLMYEASVGGQKFKVEMPE